MTFSPIRNQHVESWYVADDVKVLSQAEAQNACGMLNRHPELTKERDDARRERDELRTALTWMCIGDTGAVAEALLWAAIGHDSKWTPDVPLNIYKRDQCVRAIRKMPWLLPALEKLEAQSEQWREQGKLIRAELNREAKS